MIGLIKNELLKLRHRPILYISFALVIAAVLAFSALIVYSNIQMAKAKENQKNQLQTSLNEAKKWVEEAKTDEDKAFAKQQLEGAQYCFDNNIKSSDPRFQLVDVYISNKYSEDEEAQKWAETVKKCIETNDFKTYYGGVKAQYEKQLTTLDKNTQEYEGQQVEIEAIDLRLKYNILSGYGDPRADSLNQYVSNKQQLIAAKYDKSQWGESIDVDSLEKANKVLMYRIENNIPDIQYNNEANILRQLSYANIMIIILMIVIGATMFTSEFSYGTVGQLMIYPNKRYKIIVSKLAVIIGLTIIMQAVLYGASILAASLVEPTGANTFHMLFISGDTIYSLDFYYYLFLKYLCYFGQFLFYLSVVLFFALITKNAAATIGITVPLLLIVTPILQFINQMIPKLKLWVVPFNTANFVQYLDMEYALPGYNLPWAVVITVATITVFTFFGFRRFKRINI